MTLASVSSVNGCEDDSDMFGPPRSSPPIGFHHHRSRVPMISPKLRQREERKRILQLCAHKLERIRDSEANLRRSVCINNTYCRLTDELRREKQLRYLANLPRSETMSEIIPETARDNIFNPFNNCDNDAIIDSLIDDNSIAASTKYSTTIANQENNAIVTATNLLRTTRICDDSDDAFIGLDALSLGYDSDDLSSSNHSMYHNHRHHHHHHHHQDIQYDHQHLHHNQQDLHPQHQDMHAHQLDLHLHHHDEQDSNSDSRTLNLLDSTDIEILDSTPLVSSSSSLSTSSSSSSLSLSMAMTEVTPMTQTSTAKPRRRLISTNNIDKDLEILDRELSAINSPMPLIDPEITQGAEQLEKAISSRKRQRSEDESDRLVREALQQFYIPPQRLISAIDDCPLDLVNMGSISPKRPKLTSNGPPNDLDLEFDVNQNQKEFEVIMDALRLSSPSPTSSVSSNDSSCGQAAMLGETTGGFHNLVVTSLET